jgi:polyisoprenyl-teichoic acid--peptidoglycan teichoic acid transferase
MNLLEERLRRLMVDATHNAPPVPDRATALRQRIRRRRRLRAASVAAVAAVTVAAALGGLVGLRSALAHPAVGLAAPSAIGVKANGNHVTVAGAKNILLIRIDGRSGTADPFRADSIVLLHIPAAHDRGELVSIPTFMDVAIPAYDNGKEHYSGGNDRIGAAFSIGARGLDGADARRHGTDQLARTINHLSGITFDAVAVVDYTGYQNLLAVLGGVDVYVDEQTTSVDVGYDSTGQETAPYRLNRDGTVGPLIAGVTPRVYNVGRVHLAPWEALDYTRQQDLLAKLDGGYGQARHQEQVLQAAYGAIIARGITTDPIKLNAFLNAVAKSATVDTGGIPITDWVFAMRGISADSLIGLQLNGGQFHTMDVSGESVETLSSTSIDLLEAVRADTVDDFTAAHPDWVTPVG